MPRFFFHVYDDGIARDDEGHVLPGLEAAMAEAMSGARSLACEQVLAGHLNLGHRIEITDGAGAVLAVVKFEDAVAVRGGATQAAAVAGALSSRQATGARCS